MKSILYIIFSTIFCISTHRISAQTLFELEASIGHTIFQGDLSNVPSVGISASKFGIRYNINPSLSISGDFNNLRFNADATLSDNVSAKELNLNLEWYPLKRVRLQNIDFSKRHFIYHRRFQPYLSTGIGVANANLAAPLPFNNILQISGLAYIPIHIKYGLRYFITKQFALHVSSAWRYTNTDALDSVVLGETDDWYASFDVGIVFALGALRKVHPK